MIINDLKKISFALLLAGVVSLTSCKDDEEKLPPIDGYNNSNEIAATSLKGHWTFEGNDKEVISNTASTKTYGNVTYTTGQIGQAVSLAEGAIVYPVIAALNEKNGFGDYTMSLWLNAKNVASFQQYFGLFPTANTDFWGNFSVGAEASRHAANSDTLEIKTDYLSENGDGSLNGQNNVAQFSDKGGQFFKGAGKWSLVTVRFTAATHKLEIFTNGVNVGGYNDRGDNTTAMVLRVPSQVIIGSFATKAMGFTSAPDAVDWSKLAIAQIDDVRLFNKSLSDTEIKALYNVGLAGR